MTIRNLKAMGLALGALLVTGAVLAPSASAQFETESTPVTLASSSNSMQEFAPTAGGVAMQFTTVALDNSTLSTTPTTTIEVKPTFTGGESFIGLTTVVNMNGCGYLFHSAPGSTTATTDVKCPSGKAIEFLIGAGYCLYEVFQEAANTGLGTVTFNNTGTGTTREIDMHFSITGIRMVRVNNGFGCPAGGTSGTFTGTWTVTGKSGSSHAGVFMD